MARRTQHRPKSIDQPNGAQYPTPPGGWLMTLMRKAIEFLNPMIEIKIEIRWRQV
jgi:hypothetical protein